MLVTACWARTALCRRAPLWGEFIAFAPLFALALVAAAEARDWALHGLFANYWHGFFLGVLAYHAGWRRRSPVMLCVLAAVAFWGGVRAPGVFGVPCAVTAVLLFVAARRPWLERGFGNGITQRLGRISYSLYLLHTPVIALSVGVWARIAGVGVLANVAGMVVVLAACLIAAAAFWWVVERPTHRLASRAFAGPGRPRASIAG